MFIINVTYVKPLSEVDRVLQAHRDHLDRHFASGKLLFCGPKVPREGGMIVGRFQDRAEADAFVKSDPFFVEGVARYEVTEFKPNRADEKLRFLIEP